MGEGMNQQSVLVGQSVNPLLNPTSQLIPRADQSGHTYVLRIGMVTFFILVGFGFLALFFSITGNKKTNAATDVRWIPTPTPTLGIPEDEKPTSTPTPLPRDTTPPTIRSMTGPLDGESVSASDKVCFPMSLGDDQSVYPHILVQYKLDSNPWTKWDDNVLPCLVRLSVSTHSYTVHVKDEAGNISTDLTRTFFVK